MPEFDLNLIRVVVHEIKKEAGSNEVEETKLSETLLENNDESKKMISKLHSRYVSRHVSRCTFSESPTNFKNQYDTYISRKSDSSFLNFSRETTRLLATEMTHANSKGGYILFTEYNNYIAVYIIRNTEGNLFKYEENHFKVKNISHLDIDKFAMACRIDQEIYSTENPEERYLSIIKRGSSDISKYFTRWIGVDHTLSNKEATDSLIRVLTALSTSDSAPVNENQDPISKSELFLKIYSYINSRPGEMLDVIHLSNHLFGEGDENGSIIVNFAESINKPIDTLFEFNVSPLLKMLSTVNIESDGFDLRLNRRLLVANNPDLIVRDNEVVIKNQNIVAKFKSEL